MTSTVISIENVSKSYQLGVIGTGTFAGDLNRWWAGVRGLPDPHLKVGEVDYGNQDGETVWALRNVDLEIRQGDVIGIIGRNGAGKSTLLKILSRVTAPTSGEIKVSGRIASLLEVGTGFHPELTGRENIFLNGSILGMKKYEITRKFDEIVDFSGVERFVDTPVKRYSSGMYVRLAFAVAAHLESEILIVDEVLAVGDAEFQNKCLGKMDSVSKSEGRTVLFVSHNMGAVKKLCARGVLFDGGIKKMDGEANAAADLYTNPGSPHEFVPFRIEEIGVVVTKVSINDQSKGLVKPFEPAVIEIEMDADYDVDTVGLEVALSHDDTSGAVFRSNTKNTKNLDIKIKKGKNKATCIINGFNLCSGRYWLGFGVSLLMIKYYYYESALFSFKVAEVIAEPGSVPTVADYSHVYLDHQWMMQDR